MKPDNGQHKPNQKKLESLVERSRSGSRSALEELVRAIQDQVFGLSMRMLGHRAHAEDATQEILVKVITRLDSFRAESRFTTWVYAVAANHLRSMQARGMERMQTSWEDMERRIEKKAELDTTSPPTGEQRAYATEIRLMCLHMLLAHLDREHRLAYLLGETLELNSTEAAQVLAIEPTTFRKRLSRARKRLHDFMLKRCGLVRPDNPCQCHIWVKPALEHGAIDAERSQFVDPRDAGPQGLVSITYDQQAISELDGLDELSRIMTLFRKIPADRAPEGLVQKLSGAILQPAAT